LWNKLLRDELQAHIDAFEGPMHPSMYIKIGSHAWWDDRDYDEVMTCWRAGLPPPPKRVVDTSQTYL
jgi:hypothetical protein